MAGVLCALAVGLKYRWGYDDSLDVVGVYFVGGLWGHARGRAARLLLGSRGGRGTPPGRRARQLWRQAVAVLVVTAWSFAASLAITWLLQHTVGFRIPVEDEISGIDSVVHAETAYDLDSLGGGHPIVPRRQAAAEARLPGGGHR